MVRKSKLRVRTQELCFDIAHQDLSDRAVRILVMIWKGPNYYHVKESLKTWAYNMRCSVRSIQRALKELIDRGLIHKHYGWHKKLFLRVVALNVQKSYCDGNRAAGLIHKGIFEARRMTQTIATQVSHLSMVRIKKEYNNNLSRIENLRNQQLARARLSPIYAHISF